jgi:class 3 adenylate cyclase
MRPPGETLDLDQFVEHSGLDPNLVRRLWRAFGLPESGPLPLRVTPDAAGAMRFLVAMSARFGEEMAFAIARVVGSSAARIAEALSTTVRVGVEIPDLKAGKAYSDVVREYSSAGRGVLPLFLAAVDAVIRRHIIIASSQLWSADSEQAAVALERTVGFADLVGSTAVVRAGSVATMVAMLRRFEEMVWDLVTGAGGRVVKLIGDEAMFVVEDPGKACALALVLTETSPAAVRVGLAHGAVSAIYGDYYGEPVNLAARLVSSAEPSTVIVADGVRNAAGDAFAFDALPRRAVKGFAEPIASYRLRRP